MNVIIATALIGLVLITQGLTESNCKVHSEHYLQRRLLLHSTGTILIGNATLLEDSHPAMFEDPGSCKIVRSINLTNTRSLCPWFLRANENLNRHPVTIMEAFSHCNRKKCQAYPEDAAVNATCAPIKKPVAVLYQKRSEPCDEFGFYHYELAIEDINIAYTCVQDYVPHS